MRWWARVVIRTYNPDTFATVIVLTSFKMMTNWNFAKRAYKITDLNGYYKWNVMNDMRLERISHATRD